MEQRVILVTGANGDLGCSIARAFLTNSQTCIVWMAMHVRRDRVDALASEFPERCRVVRIDVRSAEEWRLAITQVLSCDKRLDVLVNNAGIHNDALLGMMSTEAWRGVMEINLDGVFHGCQAVLSAMISQRGGRIINIASLSALAPPMGQTNYAAAKAGVVALTQALAKEVARLGVTVNAICPGYIETEALNNLTETDRKHTKERIPMRRFGRPEEVSSAVVFLSCPDASYITGSVLKIDGGML